MHNRKGVGVMQTAGVLQTATELYSLYQTGQFKGVLQQSALPQGDDKTALLHLGAQKAMLQRAPSVVETGQSFATAQRSSGFGRGGLLDIYG